MICPYCGQDNPEDLEVCGFCGGSLLETIPPPAFASQPTEPFAAESQTQPEAMVDKAYASTSPSGPTGGLYANRTWWIIGCVVFLCLGLACVALAIGLIRNFRTTGLIDPTSVANNSPIAVNSTPQQAWSSGQNNLVTGSPGSAAQQTLTPGAVSTPEQIYFDDFTDPNSGWDQASDNSYTTSYYQGAYRIQVNSEMSDSWANPIDLIFDDVRLEVDAAKNSGPDDNDFGVICRYLDSNRFYYALISSDGYYGISKVSPDATVLLGREHLDYSDKILQGSATNHIRFDCIGNRLTLYVNGQLLDQQTDDEYITGNVGLIAGTYETAGTDVLFDNFSVYVP